MKYLIVFLIILLQPNVIFGFTAYTFVKESDFEKNKGWLCPNREKTIASFSDKSFSKEYRKLFEELLKNENNLAKKQATENKMLSFFYKNEANTTSDGYIANTAEASAYQLGHYFAFGIFDPYYNDKRPSCISRTKSTPIDKQKALYYLNKVKIAQGYLRLLPDTWLTDYEKGLGMACLDTQIPQKDIVSYLSGVRKLDFFKAGSYSKERFYPKLSYKEDYSLNSLVTLLGILSKLPSNHPSYQQMLPQMETNKIISLALSYQKSRQFYETVYYSTIAALRGNANGVVVLIDEFAKMWGEEYKKNNPTAYRAGLFHQDLTTIVLGLNFILKDLDCDYNDLIIKIADYYTEIADGKFDAYSAEIKAQKAAKRGAIWKNIGNALLNTLRQMGNQMQYDKGSNYNISDVGNFNSLINPQLAVSQVYNQLNMEYNAFCQSFKKFDGTAYSFNEWLAMRGQSTNPIRKNDITIGNGSQKNKSRTSGKKCTTCNGTGRMSMETFPEQYGMDNSYKVKCNECGEYFPKSWGHTHVTCTSCHGKGYYGL